MRISDWSSDVCSSDLAQLLDAADGLEARLRDARAEIEAIAGSNDNPVREAMQEMLRQRLWLQQHGDGASLEQLRAVRDSIEDARRRIDRQLVEVERARAPQRSEEHTSELQSLMRISSAVFCLKKNTYTPT